MSKYQFSELERVAIWTADQHRCFYEGTPVLFRDLQIDHIVPEGTSETKMLELRPFLAQDFAINSVQNWVTCHQGCNCRKGSSFFETRRLLYYLQIAENRAPKVRETIEKLRRARENEKLLSSLAVRVEQGHLTQAEVLEAVCGASKPAQTRDEPWVVTFGVNFGEPLPEGVPERDPQLSDWLIERLERDLTGTGAIFQFIDDERSGETTSVRCAFWVFDFDRIQEQIDFCWDILEVQMYSEVFGDMPDDL